MHLDTGCWVESKAAKLDLEGGGARFIFSAFVHTNMWMEFLDKLVQQLYLGQDRLPSLCGSLESILLSPSPHLSVFSAFR